VREGCGGGRVRCRTRSGGEGSPAARGKSICVRHLPAAELYGTRVFCWPGAGQGQRGAAVVRKNSSARFAMQLYATELMGSEAYDAQGHFVGRVREFFIEPADQPNRVSHFLLSRGRFQPLVARHNQVSAIAPGTLRLNCSERERRCTPRTRAGWRCARTCWINRSSTPRGAKWCASTMWI